jgi:hypothetical protein
MLSREEKVMREVQINDKYVYRAIRGKTITGTKYTYPEGDFIIFFTDDTMLQIKNKSNQLCFYFIDSIDAISLPAENENDQA